MTFDEQNTISFNRTSDIPINFTGVCKIVEPNQIRWYKNGIRHRLDGPAVIRYYNENGLKGLAKLLYFIEDHSFTKKEYWQHPLVIKAILNKIVEL